MKLKISIAGDVMLGRLVDQIFPTHVNSPEDELHTKYFLTTKPSIKDKIDQLGYKYPWGDLLPILENSDLRIINLETSATTHPIKWPNKAFNYRMHPDNLQILKKAKIDYCSLANNHILDFGEVGMLETMHSLDSRGIKWAGCGRHLEDAKRPAILSVSGLKFAFFSASDHPSIWTAKGKEGEHEKPGIFFMDAMHYRDQDVQDIKERVEEIKNAENIDFVIFSIHWGSNYAWTPPIQFQELAHKLMDHAHIDLIHGHSSHHIQGIEIYKEKPIIYGCGDFIDDYAVDEIYRNNLGFLYLLTLDTDKRKFESIELIPTKIKDFAVTKQLETEERDWLWQRMTSLSKKFGTVVTKSPMSFNISIP